MTNHRLKRVRWEGVDRRRVARNYLDEPAPPSRLAGVVESVCGVQAQVMTAAELALAARVRDITKDDVRNALWEKRTLVKVPSLRTTLHIHSADDVSLWMAACATRRYWLDDESLEPHGLTPDRSLLILDAIRDALDGRSLTRDELGNEIATRLGPWVLAQTGVITWGGRPGIRWHHLIAAAAYTGRLCFGRNRGNRVTFVRPDQWLGEWESRDESEALQEAARRYLAAYGPARDVDFAHWLWIDRRAAASVFEQLRGELVEVELDGVRAWQSPVQRRTRASKRRAIRLLPEYDCYVIGASPPGKARQHVTEAAARRIFDGGAGPHPALVVDGTVAGAWTRRRRGKRVEIGVETFLPLRAADRRAVAAEAERVAKFLRAELALSLT